MSWFSNLAETYDRVWNIAGISDEKGNILLPPNYMDANTDVHVTIDGNGGFRRAAEGKENIIIPCTEDSASRSSSAVFPHPLHDQLGYLAADQKKHDAYLKQLAAWNERHPKVAAVYKYITRGTLLNDLRASNIKIDGDNPENQKKLDKIFVRFSVELLDDFMPNLWEDATIVKAWQEYCSVAETHNKTLCYVTGEYTIPTRKHPRGINKSASGAKLISCNDHENYTYRGRFTASEQANSIGAKASHKAHAMLKYLIASQGYKCDTQAVVAWAIDNGHSLPDPFADSLGLYAEASQTDSDKLIEAQGELAHNYAVTLRKALRGKGNAAQLAEHARRIAIIATDAATRGRMGITFYQDLHENDYIDRIIAWHTACCWWFWKDGHEYVSAPSADRIIAAVYGEPKGESYDKIKKQARERLLHNIVCGEPLNRSWVSAAVQRVNNPFSYAKERSGWDKEKWMAAVNVACAMIKKHCEDKKEEFSLELDIKCTDRDYLYGRLLAIADRLESHARYLQTNKDDTDKRPTNAVRYITAFASKPSRTWQLIYRQLNPYMQRLDGAEWYQLQIDEIMSLFLSEEFNDKPLGGKYLLGYSLQRRERFKNKNNKEDAANEPEQEN